MKIVVMGSLAESLVNFRGELLKNLVARGHQVIGCAPRVDIPELDGLRAAGIRFENVCLERVGLNPIEDARSIASMIRILRRHRPDAVLLYTVKPVLYGTIAATMAKVGRIYSIVTGLGHVFLDNSVRGRCIRPIVCQLYARTLPLNEHVLFQNRDDRSLFVQKGFVDPNKTTVIAGSGVDLQRFSATLPVLEPFSFLVIARLLEEKGIYEYVEAARQTKKVFPHVRCRLLGPHCDRPASIPRSVVREWQEEGTIEYLGVNKDVRPALAAASVFVLPSYREGTSRATLEALAMGKPVITTDAPGCRETVVPGKNGLLVPPRDANALARAMQGLVEDSSRIATLGANSRNLAEQRFDVHKVNQQIMSVLEA